MIDVELLICPLLELTPHRNSRRELATGFLLDEETIAWFVRHYAGDRDPDELASDPRRVTQLHIPDRPASEEPLW